MGYCYTTGKKVRGRWKFVKCNGNTNICAVDKQPLPKGERARDCVEFCKTHSEAVKAVEDWERSHPGE